VLLLRSREPVHGGKPLSAWVQDLSSPDEETRALALESILQIGPRAVPFLLKPFRLFSPPWKIIALEWLTRYTPLKIDWKAREDQFRGAFHALHALGTNAAVIRAELLVRIWRRIIPPFCSRSVFFEKIR
jgi:hypothetical protein